MIKAILFDFDGTIVTSLQPSVEAYNRVATKRKLPVINAEQLPEIRKQPAYVLFDQLPIRKIQLPFLVRAVRKELFNHIEELKLAPGIVSTIKKLSKDYDVYIVSSNTQKFIKTYLDLPHNKELLSFVKQIFCHTAILGKSRLLKRVLQKTKLKPSEVIYIGDEQRDIEACKTIGIPIIAVNWGFSAESVLKKGTPYFAKSSDEILKLVNKIAQV